MKKALLILIALVALAGFGCVSQQQIRSAQLGVERMQEVVLQLQGALQKAEDAKANPELIATIREQLAKAEAMGMEAQTLLADLEAGDPWWLFGLKVASGIAGTIAVVVPQFRTVQAALKATEAGLNGAVRFADGLKKETGIAKDRVEAIAAATVNDSEQEAIRIARERENV